MHVGGLTQFHTSTKSTSDASERSRGIKSERSKAGSSAASHPPPGCSTPGRKQPSSWGCRPRLHPQPRPWKAASQPFCCQPSMQMETSMEPQT